MQGLVFASATHGEVLALGLKGRSLVGIAGDAGLASHALGQLTSQQGTLLQRDAAHGDEGQHVGGSHAGMGTVVAAHVDDLGGFLRSAEGGLAYGLGTANESDDGAVGGVARVDIKQAHAIYTLDGIGDLTDDGHVAPLAKIRDALDDLVHSIGEMGLMGLVGLVGMMGKGEGYSLSTYFFSSKAHTR